MTSQNSRSGAGLPSLYSGVNRLLRNADIKTASFIIISVAAGLAIVTHVSLHYLSTYLLNIDPHGYPVALIAADAALAAIITAAPIVVYCMTLIRRLRQTKYDLKKAVAAAQSANAAKSSFLANMSHEIRTPLNGVLGMADVLSRQELTPSQADCVTTIRESGKALMTILNDVLDLSKIEAGKLDIAPIDADLHHVFESIGKLFAPRAEEKNLSLDINISPDVPVRLRFDTVRIRQCVANLLSNAIKFTSNGSVTISVSSTPRVDGGHLISVVVSDTGIGMGPEILDGLFTDYSQGDASTARRFGGTELGIAIARRLARLMQGDITVVSKPGAGSTFTMTFVTANAQAVAVRPMDAKGPVAAGAPEASLMFGARVLIVDDNPVNRKVIRLLLKPVKMELTEADDGRKALHELADADFDLVLLDVHMPVMDGYETIKHIRASSERWRDIPVVALTADAMSGTRERLLEAGMSGYASKPIDQRALISEIGRVLGERQGGEARLA